MKVTVEQISPERAEEVLLRCHDPKEPWVEEIQSIAAGQITVNGMADGKLCLGTMLFRCSKSMILNAGKIDYVLPSLSGRFEAVLDNGEKVIISRQYVSTLKRLLGR